MASLLDNMERVSLEDIQPHPENARKGNVAAIRESLEENQQFAPLVVQRGTGYILSGNHTYRAARELGWTEIDVVYADVDDDRARKILLAANRTSDLGTYDDEALLNLLEALGDDFQGTGYTADDLDDLLSALDKLPVAPFTPTEATYAETPEEYQQRAEMGSGMSLAARGIRETVIILVQDDHDELHRHLAQLRSLIKSDADLTNGELLLRAARSLRLAHEAYAEDEGNSAARSIVELTRTPL